MLWGWWLGGSSRGGWDRNGIRRLGRGSAGLRGCVVG